MSQYIVTGSNHKQYLKEVRVSLTRTDMSQYIAANKNSKIDSTKKNQPESFKNKETKNLKQIVALSQSALYCARAVRLWDQLKKNIDKNIKFALNDIVCARMSGHRPWPAIISEFKKNGTVLKFFGSHDSGIVKKSEIVHFHLCKDIIAEYLKVPIADLCVKTLNYHLLFIKATKEVSCISQNVQ